MGDKSKIAWTEASWNPFTGCTPVSAGCDRCYAARDASTRLAHLPAYKGLARDGKFTGEVRLHPGRLDQPFRWLRHRRIFVNSTSDLFHEGVSDAYLADVFAVMAAAGWHHFQALTKRHGRMRSLLSSPRFARLYEDAYRRLAGRLAGLRLGLPAEPPPLPLPNVWLGVSVEDPHWARIRIPALLETPAAVRFISAEPLLGLVTLDRWLRDDAYRHGLHWVIVGGESGPGARAMSLAWAETLVRECQEARVPVFMKQLGRQTGLAWAAGPKGDRIDAFPAHLRVREYPEVASDRPAA